MDELADAERLARGEDVFGAGDVGGEEVGVAAPDSGLGGDMEDDIDAGNGAFDRRGIGEVAERLFDSEFVEPGVGAAGEGADVPDALAKEADDRAAEEPEIGRASCRESEYIA